MFVTLGGPLKFTMVDWSEPKKPIEDGLGGDRGQVTFSVLLPD